MPSNKFIKSSRISNGQYTVSIRLQRFKSTLDLCKFEKDLNEVTKHCGNGSSETYRFDGDKLTYTSETLFPPEKYVKKQKVFLVFGNPAFHSVKNGMFFFSKANNHRHGMWGKLEKAGLIKRVRINDDDLFIARKREAEERKKLISRGQASEEYCLGLTTFYSFPTPVRGRYRDVKGVEKLFRPILENTIVPFEINRIFKYPFTKNAILVFVQKSSYERFTRHCNKNALFWPVRGKNSSGKSLSEMLK